jgi:hypothetical protein
MQDTSGSNSDFVHQFSVEGTLGRGLNFLSHLRSGVLRGRPLHSGELLVLALALFICDLEETPDIAPLLDSEVGNGRE